MENIFLGNLIYNSSGVVQWNEMRQRASAMIKDLEMDIPADEIVENLSVAEKQIVEICKAINLDCKVLIMDEPSATLTSKELNVMFEIIKKLQEKNVTIIYISHRLEEIFSIADDVTVLRDGTHVNTLPITAVDRDKLISLMVGRFVSEKLPKEFHAKGEVVLEIKNLNRHGVLHDINFKVHKSEVLGIAGLVGAGRTELARAILGIDKLNSGEIILHGKPVKHKTFKDAIDNGFGLIPEDRKHQGLVQIFSIRTNACLACIDKIIRRGIVNIKKEKQLASKYSDRLGVVAPNIETEVQYLSGGNQQKVIIAKWLMRDSEIIFLDEPTRGIDVGAKHEIYQLINKFTREGKTVILISSELPEVIGMSDRILVMHEGKMVGELSHEEATQEKIMALCV